MNIPIEQKYQMADWLAKAITGVNVDCFGGYPGDAIDYGEFVAITIPDNEGGGKYTAVQLYKWEDVVKLSNKFDAEDAYDDDTWETFYDECSERELRGINTSDYLWRIRNEIP